jgi:hypothetical protein
VNGTDRLIYIQCSKEQSYDADRIVLGTPMWNFGLSYKLKQLIDLAAQRNYLFTYDGKRYGPLLHAEDAIVVYTRGARFMRVNARRDGRVMTNLKILQHPLSKWGHKKNSFRCDHTTNSARPAGGLVQWWTSGVSLACRKLLTRGHPPVTPKSDPSPDDA